eukprot:CAMPEP_0205802092 /NCGR_PEP_ID=MMETSP0205-20121125/4294_1 /ASSEMBLY_ACC=CAM_ASM_000278 /TAXON_ID=36767 /ORGANISM="Euplotes focardii, Strain TN1" /LENGTH=63 /DNA_ID=CAMNT_0053067921 /DNA_START=1 /DNA_END=189 /DNA_ORIENTATION=+
MILDNDQLEKNLNSMENLLNFDLKNKVNHTLIKNIVGDDFMREEEVKDEDFSMEIGETNERLN